MRETELNDNVTKALALLQRSQSILNVSSITKDSPPTEVKDNIWDAYRNVEYAIALLKLEHGEDFHTDIKHKGTTTRVPQPNLADVISMLKDAEQDVYSGNFAGGIVKLRQARDILADML